MRIIIQRVSEASVRIDDRISGSISLGFMVLLGIVDGDGQEDIEKPCASGEFGADMQVSLVNEGPVTIIIDSQLRE